jgi:seryl-tRNA synthetase|nr:hypothetical protein [Moraxella osloensis]
MANESQKKSLIDKIARLEKDLISLQHEITKKTEEHDKLTIEFNKSSTGDLRKKSIITRQATLQKDIISFKKKLSDKTTERVKLQNQLLNLK